MMWFDIIKIDDAELSWIEKPKEKFKVGLDNFNELVKKLRSMNLKVRVRPNHYKDGSAKMRVVGVKAAVYKIELNHPEGRLTSRGQWVDEQERPVTDWYTPFKLYRQAKVNVGSPWRLISDLKQSDRSMELVANHILKEVHFSQKAEERSRELLERTINERPWVTLENEIIHIRPEWMKEISIIQFLKNSERILFSYKIDLTENTFCVYKTYKMNDLSELERIQNREGKGVVGLAMTLAGSSQQFKDLMENNIEDLNRWYETWIQTPQAPRLAGQRPMCLSQLKTGSMPLNDFYATVILRASDREQWSSMWGVGAVQQEV